MFATVASIDAPHLIAFLIPTSLAEFLLVILAIARSASYATPLVPLPVPSQLPAAMEAIKVPWPTLSAIPPPLRPLHLRIKHFVSVIDPANSLWPIFIPLSMIIILAP